MANEDVIMLSADSGSSDAIKLSDSNAFVYAGQAKESAESASASAESAREYMNNTLEYKNYMDTNIANLQGVVQSLNNIEDIQANAEFLYNRMYFGEYYDEDTASWITYKKIEYDENHNLLNKHYRVQNGVDENNQPVFLTDENDEYILEECAIYKMWVLEQRQAFQLGQGKWAEEPINSAFWHVVDGSDLSADDYPEMWDYLNDILDGTKTSEDIDVISSTQVSSLTSGNEDWEVIAGQQRLAYCYILDLTNRTFTLPRCIPSSLCIGKSEYIVSSGASNYAGEYLITNYGNYIETSFLCRLEKATKTVSNETYTYYKPTQWSDSETAIAIEYDNTHGLPCVTFTELLDSTLKKQLINDKYTSLIFKALPYETQEEEGKTSYYLTDFVYLGMQEEQKTRTTYSVKLKLYDEQYKYCDLDHYKKLMGNNESSVMLCYQIHGFVIPPALADYNVTDKRLYIKVR